MQTLTELTALFAEGGGEAYYGEPVTQLAHALQCAQLAEQAGADLDTVVAALLHDIGHLLPAGTATELMDDYGRVDHERLGAEFLRQRGFSEKVGSLIKNHVNAKRYLTATNPDYYARLSDASRQTLAFQGGPMTPAEVVEFEQYADFQDIIYVRRWDEAAKIPNLPTPDLAHYLDMCRVHLTK